jgi:hypothetical protein
MESFTVVFGTTVYMPRWMIGTDNGADILRHEAVHMRDSKKYHAFYLLSYIMLPIGPSGRAFWEYRGYCESMKAYYERHKEIPDWLIEFYVSQFTTSSYLWMFPFPKVVRHWFWKYRQKLLSQS